MPTLSEYLDQANDTIVTILQIETKEALDAVDQIATVGGVDALFLGLFDLGKCHFVPSLRDTPWEFPDYSL